MTTLIISNEKMDNISWAFSCLNKKSVIETIKTEAKEERGGLIGMLLDTLSASKSINR